MSKPQPELVTGVSQHLLFSPKGGIEGVLISAKGGTTVQVAMPPPVGAALADKFGPGKRVRVLGVADQSPKTAHAAHPVFVFESLADAKGNAVEWDEGAAGTKLKGIVARIHYAKHGEPNGVVLESGEFIHLRPHGMEALGLEVGARVSASGEPRVTVLGTRMLEAHSANGVDIE